MTMDVPGSNMRSNTKQTQFPLTLNTKVAFLASWPLAVAIGYGALAVVILKLNYAVSGADELSCWQNGWQNGKCFVLDG